MEEVTRTLAANVRAARQALGWRLEDLATRSGVSRNMVQQIETARTNASVATLARLAATLGVPIGVLVEPPEELGYVARAAEVLERPAGRASRSRLLVNDGQAPFVEVWDFVIAAGDEIRSPGHPAGTRELLHLYEGELQVGVGGAEFELREGDALRMRGDRPHVYRNPGTLVARLGMTVVYSGERDPRYA
ncbi:helix-turn-helix domain-containing protein [Nonomuraea sp. NPDC050328]|uniref:helix-turn-helix domain-containing protein n=1 Tax=Nonomuraea sp. NPDC050328 TaxID=3364361 RepID=UPI0037976657